MSVSLGLHFDCICRKVWLVLTDGEKLAAFPVSDPQPDRLTGAMVSQLQVGDEIWRMVFSTLTRFEIFRPGGEVLPSREELLKRFGHRMDAGVSNG